MLWKTQEASPRSSKTRIPWMIPISLASLARSGRPWFFILLTPAPSNARQGLAFSFLKAKTDRISRTNSRLVRAG